MPKKKNKKVSKTKSKEIKGQLGKKKETDREKMIGQSIGYRYDVNLLPDYSKITPFLKKYIEAMGWDDLNWLEDVHMGYEEDRPAVFCRNANGWVTIPSSIKLPNNQQDRDMIAREKNAQARNHKKVELPSSNFKTKIADILKNEGFIKDFKVSSEEKKPMLSLELKYHSGNPVISAFERVSKPGRRIFSSADSLPKINNGLGIAIVSTPKGVMTDIDARKQKVGGEIICKVF